MLKFIPTECRKFARYDSAGLPNKAKLKDKNVFWALKKIKDDQNVDDNIFKTLSNSFYWEIRKAITTSPNTSTNNCIDDIKNYSLQWIHNSLLF